MKYSACVGSGVCPGRFYNLFRLFLISAWLFLGAMLFPFTFEPISQDFQPAGEGANRTFRIDNEGTEKIAVKISVMTREMHPDGSETNADASSNFMIYPKHAIVAPESFKTVRVKWKGDSSPAAELAFRIVAEQVPVEFEPNPSVSGGGIRLALRYMGNIYIVPDGIGSDIVIAEAVPVYENGTQLLELTFRNDGSSHSLLAEPTLTLIQGDYTIILAGDDLKGIAGENILAGSSRIFRIPRPEGLGNGEFQTEFSYRHLR